MISVIMIIYVKITNIKDYWMTNDLFLEILYYFF